MNPFDENKTTIRMQRINKIRLNTIYGNRFVFCGIQVLAVKKKGEV